MDSMNFDPSQFDTSADRRADKELSKILKPVPGTCTVCLAEVNEDGHESWCTRVTPSDILEQDLPDMWSHSDFEGGDPDPRSYKERGW